MGVVEVPQQTKKLPVVGIADGQGPLDSQGLLTAAVSSENFKQLTPAEKAEAFQAAMKAWENLQQVEDDL